MSGPDAPFDMKARVRAQFENSRDVWPSNDLWGRYTHSEIERRTLRIADQLGLQSKSVRLLNLGSHGNAYGLVESDHFQVDLSAASLAGISLASVADVEALPFADGAFDAVICVGSVINYCSVPRVLDEVSRVLRAGGYLVLEFETSESFEFAFSKDYRKDNALAETFYNGSSDQIYVYSESYVKSAMAVRSLSILTVERFHHLSTLAYLVTHNERLAAWFARFDNFAAKFKVLSRHSANILVAAQKIVEKI